MTLTDQQARLRDAAQALLDAIDETVAPTTVHWLVQETQQAARKLASMADTVITRDARPDRRPLVHVSCDEAPWIHTLADHDRTHTSRWRRA